MNRRGVSILEAMVVVSLGTVILLVAGRCIHTLLRGGRDVGRSIVQAKSLSRLSRDFRRDVRAAKSVDHLNDPAAGEDLCRIKLNDDDQIVYRRGMGGALLRIELRSEQIANREAYSISEGDTQVSISGKPPLAMLTHRWKPSSSIEERTKSAVEREFRVIAELGRDHRFSHEDRPVDGGDR